MPQVDLESLVSAFASSSSDRKITCETLAGDIHSSDETDLPDWAPESFWLSGDAEYDWFDRNAIVYERKESTKGSSISHTNNPGSNSNSQRFSSKNLKPKAAIIGLPKPQKTAFAEAKNRRHNRHGNTTLFPKRSASVGKLDRAVVVEPSSPKVSCIGRVRSKRDRNRRLRTRQRSVSSSSTAVTVACTTTTTVTATEVVRQISSRSGRKKSGFFESVRAIFRSNRRGKPVQKPELAADDSTTKKSKTKKRSSSKKGKGSSKASQKDASLDSSISIEPPGLGGLNRFASGRRSESWGVGDNEIHVPQ